MTVNQAQQIVLAIGGVATAVWLVHVVLWWLQRQAVKPRGGISAEAFELRGEPDPFEASRSSNGIVPLSRRLPGLDATSVRDLLPRAAALQHPAWDLVGGDMDGAIFEVPVSAGRVSVSVMLSDEGDAREPVCAVICALDTANTGGVLRGIHTFWVWVVIPIAILGLGALMWRVSGMPQPAARGQAWQMAQIMQFLWEPFLFLGLLAQQRKAARQQVERFVDALSLL